MDKTATENLFLLEFLVDRIQIDPTIVRDYGDVAGDTCVSVQFLDNAPLDICEDDFTPKRRYAKECDTVKSGKSCLFSLSAEQAAMAGRQFDVYVDVFKKMPQGVLPEKLQVGHSLISIVNLFKELLESIAEPIKNVAPTAKTLKDVFKITNASGQYIGDISMYIRMSCFGKLIVTQFQMNLEDKSVLFKDKEGHSLYRYKKVGKSQMDTSLGTGKNPCASWCPGVSTNQQQQNQRFEKISCPSVYTDIPCSNYTVLQAQSQQTQQAPPNLKGHYQEIGAQMGGNALTIRVHKDTNKVEGVNDEDFDTGSCLCGSDNRQKTKTGHVADSMPPLPPCPPCTNQKLVLRPCLNPGAPTANQPFNLQMGMCPQNNVTVVPPVCTAPDGTQYTELSDPDRDVFILRIGKKSEGVEKKNNLELELCTPKGLDTKPIPKKETRDTQWEDADFLKAGGSKVTKKQKTPKKGKGKRKRTKSPKRKGKGKRKGSAKRTKSKGKR